MVAPEKLLAGLDLRSDEDRAIFRTRVAEYYALTKALNVALDRKAITGRLHTVSRGQALRDIADHWIEEHLLMLDAAHEQSRGALERWNRP